mmetsp:Transcript_6392/g.15386  ORF Transcript_6392/g.15386 Transcript_6392/m.15386 type:complete len:542 (+) Transcript_6392:96-1721(+)
MKTDPLTSLYTVWSPGYSSQFSGSDNFNQKPFSTGSGEDSASLESRVVYQSPACPSSLVCRSGRSWMVKDFGSFTLLADNKICAVFKAIYKHANVPVVLKVFFRKRLSPVTQHQLAREIDIHSKLNHPNVIQLYGVFEDESVVCMVLECASHGDLLTHISDPRVGYIEEVDARPIVVDALKAVEYLHDNGIIHRDIKPENFVVTSTGVKLIDFGVSIDTDRERPVSAVGTKLYMPPEVAACPLKRAPSDFKSCSELHYGSAADIWSLGVLVAELLTGRASVPSHSNPSPMRGGPLSSLAQDFIAAATREEPLLRPSAEALLRHGWLRDVASSSNRAERCQTPSTANAHGQNHSSAVRFNLPAGRSRPNNPRGPATDVRDGNSQEHRGTARPLAASLSSMMSWTRKGQASSSETESQNPAVPPFPNRIGVHSGKERRTVLPKLKETEPVCTVQSGREGHRNADGMQGTRKVGYRPSLCSTRRSMDTSRPVQNSAALPHCRRSLDHSRAPNRRSVDQPRNLHTSTVCARDLKPTLYGRRNSCW